MQNSPPILPPFYKPAFPKLLKEMQASNLPPELPLNKLTTPRGMQTIFQEYNFKKPTNLWLYLFIILKKEFLFASLTSLISSIAALSSAFIAMHILQIKIEDKHTYIYAFAFFSVNLVWQVFSYYTNLIRNITKTKAWIELSSLVLCKIPTVQKNKVDALSSGNYKVLLCSDVDNISNFYDNFFRNAIPAIIHLGILTPFAWKICGFPGIIAMFIACLQIPYASYLGKKGAKILNLELTEKDKLTTVIGEALNNVRIIRYLSWENQLSTEIKKLMQNILKLGAKSHVIICLIFGMSFSWWMLSTASLVLSAKYFRPDIGAAPIFAVSWMVILASRYLMHVANTVRLFALASPSMLRVKNLLDKKDSWLIAKEKEYIHPEAPRKIAKIIFKNVCFSHNEKSILQNLCFSIDFSSRTALLGSTGSGKTTIFRLLLGLEIPTSGEIFIEFTNGDIDNILNKSTIIELRKQLAWVPQENFIANDTILANLTMEENNATSQEIWSALETAEFSSDILSWQKGIQTEIGENGINLSGGQQQRLSIARALYANKNYMLLDDCLSSLDKSTEKLLVDNLLSLQTNFLLITHRVQELSKMDLILVLDEGSIVAQGTFAELTENPKSQLNNILRAYSEPEL